MREVFADTWFWISAIYPRDILHHQSVEIQSALESSAITLVTTDEVLVEFLAYFSARGRYLRTLAAATVSRAFENQLVRVVPQSRQSFVAGLSLYVNRGDKEYSMVDCISMAAMRELEIGKVLTRDGHFVQEGFKTITTATDL
ncbi:hypothetical protein BH09SUM1_BH09SUM1_05010 [soil metagenome]